MPKTNSAPPDGYVVRLKNAILRLHGCESKYVETVTVSQPFVSFYKNTVWQGEVTVFEVYDHPTARRAYAWTCVADNEDTRHVIVLDIPPVSSPETAVQAAIAAEIVNGTFH